MNVRVWSITLLLTAILSAACFAQQVPQRRGDEPQTPYSSPSRVAPAPPVPLNKSDSNLPQSKTATSSTASGKEDVLKKTKQDAAAIEAMAKKKCAEKDCNAK